MSRQRDYWQATLAGQQTVGGGAVKITESGRAQAYTLYASHTLLDYQLPAGSSFDFSDYLLEVSLPDGTLLAFDPDTK